jgi:hypothetical protein
MACSRQAGISSAAIEGHTSSSNRRTPRQVERILHSRRTLRRGLGRRSPHSRPVSPTLNGFHRSRAVLLADRLDRSPIQVMAHRILPRTGHEVPRAARVSPKRSRQRLRLRPRPQQGHERVPDANPQWQQRVTNLLRQDSRGLAQERPQGCRMRYVPLPRGDGPLRRARSMGRVCRLFCLPWS